MTTSDRILIDSLTVWTRVGVTPDERAAEQRVELDLALTPLRPLANLGDDLANTIDYAAVAAEASRIAALEPRALIETLAQAIADGIMAAFPVAAVEVEVRKFILPNTRYVGVRIERRP